MYLKPIIFKNNCKQKGIALPLALFVIVIVALLLAMVVNLQTDRANASVMQIQANKAFYAAESGIQLTLTAMLPPDGSSGLACNASMGTITFSAADSLSTCVATVSCQQALVNTKPLISLQSTAQCGSGRDLAKRTVTVRF